MDAVTSRPWPPEGEDYPSLAAYTKPLKPAERKILGREREVSQVLAGLSRPELCNVLLLAPAGSGKALPDDTMVPVADARVYARMGDLKEGDQVFGKDGEPVRVKAVFPQGRKRKFLARFGGGVSLPCCGEHLWSMRGEAGGWEVINTREARERLKKGERLFIPRNGAWKRLEAELPADPYEQGISWASSPASFRYAEGFPYLYGSVSQREALFKGLTVYGTEMGGHVGLSLEYKSLAFFLASLARSLGLSCAVREFGRGTACWWHVMAGEAEGDLEVLSITDLGVREPMTCITVDSPEALYQAGEECVLTHNTALVQGTMLQDLGRLYLEVDLARMIADLSNPNEMAARLKALFDEAEEYRNSSGQDLVLFIDEFHQVSQLSAAAVEALKPLLAASGTRGIRVIAATTFDEFQQYIQPNQPLVERLYRINVREPDRATTVAILRGMAQRYGAGHLFPDDHLFESIYDYTNQYIPANSQPRKSILVLDAMLGWHKGQGRKLDRQLLADVLYDSEGVNVAFSVDGKKIKDYLNSRVLSQTAAVDAIENRLQIAVAGLNDPTKPMSSFLFAGSTGVGKQLSDDVMVPVWDPLGLVHHKRNGDLQVGDFVFNRWGKPVMVTGVFHQGVQDVYEVELEDGRILPCGYGHLWTYKSRFGNGSKHWKTTDTVSLMEKLSKVIMREGSDVPPIQFVIPMNHAVEYPAKDYCLDPYVVGAAIGNGCLTSAVFSVSSGNEFVVSKCADLIGAPGYDRGEHNYTWVFSTGRVLPSGKKCRFQTDCVLRDVPELIGLKSHEKFIPELYKYGSIDQRWRLIQGLFDTDGSIGSGSRYNVSYSTTSERLALDIQDMLYSLGISSSVKNHGIRKGRTGDCHDEYHVHVKIGNQDKYRFFTLPYKLERAVAAKAEDSRKERRKKFGDVIGVRSIRKTGERTLMTCIMVDDPEHLYQAGPWVVSHNTEMVKGVSEILFHDKRSMHRMDMSEFANPDSVDRFRETLCDKVWQRPYSVVLFDEVEKACGEVTRVLLQVLDDARLTNRLGREVSFTNCYVVLTTNAGSEIYKNIAQYNVDDTGSGKMMTEYMRLIKESLKAQGGNKFPPELLGRIDAIVPFQPLSEATMLAIVKKKLQETADRVWQQHGVVVYIDGDVADYLVKERRNTDSDAGGARAVTQRMETEVVSSVSRYINTHPEQRRITVKVVGTPAYLDKSLRISDAYIGVAPFIVPPSAAGARKPMGSRKAVIEQYRKTGL